MGRYILDVPEDDIRNAASILADIIRDYPDSKSCGCLDPKGKGYFFRRTKTGASIVQTFGEAE